MSLFPKALAAAALAWTAFGGQAHAMVDPYCPKPDTRVCYADYRPGEVVHIWSTPEAAVLIKFADDEVIFYVGSSDSKVFKPVPHQNYLFWRAQGCLVPEPLPVLTRLPDGKLRSYLFEIETHPNICPPHLKKPGPDDPQVPNLQLISQDALAPGSHEMYALIFHYPLDAWKKRQALRRAARERAEKQRTEELLRQATNPVLPGGGPAPSRNYAYVKQGDMALAPGWIWDDGNVTKMIFPQNQRIPAILYVMPDGHEASIVPSAHEKGDVLVFNVVAPEWILRDGDTVLAIGNRSYDPIGHNPGTGTITPNVRRVLIKDDDAR